MPTAHGHAVPISPEREKELGQGYIRFLFSLYSAGKKSALGHPEHNSPNPSRGSSFPAVTQGDAGSQHRPVGA